MNGINIKIIVSSVFFFSTVFCSLIPTIVSSWFNKRNQSNNSSGSSHSSSRGHLLKKMFTSCITCFGGGIFLGACMLDLLPDVIHHINTTLKNEFHYDNEHENNYPFGEILIVLGFFVVLFVEQTILSLRSSVKNLAPGINDISNASGPCKDDKIVLESDTHRQALLMSTGNFSLPTEQQTSFYDLKCHDGTRVSDLTTTRNLLMILSLVIHSVFEGIAVGSLNDSKTIIQLSVAILIHKSIIAFSVGLKLISSTHKRPIYLASIILASATPAGILLMLSMHKILPDNRGTKITNDILRAFACGTFFYITFFDVLPHELNTPTVPTGTSFFSKAYRLAKTVCVFIGFIFTSIVLVATK